MSRIAMPIACAVLLATTNTATVAGPGTYRCETSQGKRIVTGSFDVSEFSCSAGDVRYRARKS
jgi:hypothetical protein